ncbi:hypothetical protein JZO73_03870 [Enterococcus plantarum]|uniref:hypothetical protein n=1 Tax=Enterococcus plantarum TaxID=1077675 RepID=UPI001A8EDA6A|nr:hypothetical protein [Enterococcus plantarum]MBO0466667.1 hypothetical protein [Enterococcus plantarum]
MNNDIKKIVIGYIDDDMDAMYSSYSEIKRELRKMISLDEYKEFDIKPSFIFIKDEETQEDFWNSLLENNYHALIMDFRLSNSEIFDSAEIMWKRIKSYNAHFPLAIYTSYSDEVTIDKNAERIFEKDISGQTGDMINYLLKQIMRNFEEIEILERINLGLKNDQSISYSVLKNEEEIDKQFSLFYDSNYSEDEEEKFKILMENAFEIIGKYSERYDDK